jgi:hypothetical protein
MASVIAETEITVNAPIEKVWELMLNVHEYRKWNPFVVSIETYGDVSKTGTAMKLHVRWMNGGMQTSNEIIEEVFPPKIGERGKKLAHWSYRFTGPLDKLGLVHALRFQWLEENSDGTTSYKTREEFSGLLTGFLPLKKVQDGFERQAKAIRDYFQR